MKSDIQNRADIKKLVTVFYEKLLVIEEFRYFFLEIAKIDVLAHLETMMDFWESVLFQAGKYNHNTLEVHLKLHQQCGIKDHHFTQWLETFNTTVDEFFEGEKAKGAKERALSIAMMIKMKIDDHERRRLEFNN